MRFIRTLSVLSFFLISTGLYAQEKATVRGFAVAKDNGELILFAPVYLKGTNLGVNTDDHGYYTISNIKPGNYTLMMTAVGYDTIRIPISLKEGEVLTKKLSLNKRVTEMNTVEISAERQEMKTDVRMSVTKITPKELKQVPTVGGEADIAQYMQVVPGVVSTGDQGGQLYIRGGEPIQNLVLLDGMPIYNPFHSIGLFSVFDSEILRNADIYTAGFNADYGGRVSSVMDIKTRDGNNSRVAGRISASPFMSKVLIEGPISKQTNNEDEGSSSFIFSAKSSYLKQTSPIFYNYVSHQDGAQPIPYNFTDIYGKITMSAANGSKLSLFGFNFNDSAQFQGISNIGWKASGAGANFVVIPGSSPILMDGIVAYSQYSITQTQATSYPTSSGINGFNLGLNFTYFLQKDEVKFGVGIQAFNTNYDFFTPGGVEVPIAQNTNEGFAYVKYKMLFLKDKLILEPGVHLRYYVRVNEGVAEPRLGAKFNVTDHFRLKLAGGFYSQNIIGTNYDRQSVVVLFSGFLTSPDNLPPSFNGQAIETKLQKSRHIVFGFEQDLTEHLDLNVEVYYKDFYPVTNINRNKLYNTDYDFVYERGFGKGIDFQLKYNYKNIFISGIYSLALVQRQYELSDGSLYTYNPFYDRRNNVTLVGSYQFGKGYKWQLDCRFSYGSGFPFTPTAGFVPSVDFTNNGANTSYGNAPANLKIVYGDLNSKRMPEFHRLDVSVKRTFELGLHSSLELIGSVTNLYDRENVFYVDRISGQTVYQLPILPSLTAALNF